eukprot:8513727-Prorocentrum_lima.AAC.1
MTAQTKKRSNNAKQKLRRKGPMQPRPKLCSQGSGCESAHGTLSLVVESPPVEEKPLFFSQDFLRAARAS